MILANPFPRILYKVISHLPKNKSSKQIHFNCDLYPSLISRSSSRTDNMTSFPYHKVLLIGATSGIGEALATRLVESGTKVIISGRRKENLDRFVEKYGAEKVTAKVLDVMNLSQVSNTMGEVKLLQKYSE